LREIQPTDSLRELACIQLERFPIALLTPFISAPLLFGAIKSRAGGYSSVTICVSAPPPGRPDSRSRRSELTLGVREHEDHVALYYAMRRHADGRFNASRYDGISTAYRMKLVPVFVVDPDKPMGIPSRESDQGRKRAFDATSAAMIKRRRNSYYGCPGYGRQ
jgi:hypothetical protein